MRRTSLSRNFLFAEAAAFGALIVVVAGIIGAVAPDARASAASAATPALALTPLSGPVGSTVNVTGTGYGHNTVQLRWDGIADGMPVVQANGNGSFGASFRVPNGTTLGTHVVSATATTSTSTGTNKNGRGPGVNAPSESASASFVVQVATVAATPQPTAAPTATPVRTVSPSATPAPTTNPVPAPGLYWSMHPNFVGTDGSIFEVPPYYSGRTDGSSFGTSIPGPLGGIVEQQTQGGASQADPTLWVINPPAPPGNPAQWCVWDADDRVRGDFVGTLPAGQSISVTLCMIADVYGMHRAAISLAGYPQLTGSINFGEHMTMQVFGGRNGCIVGARYKYVSDSRLTQVSNTNFPAVGRYQSITFSVTNPTAASVSINVPMILGRYQGGAPYYPESRWCPNDTSDQGGLAIWQYGNWLYTSYDVSVGAKPGVWWAN